MAVDDETTAPSAAPEQRDLDNDLDPAAFLKSVRELSERRDREDTERFKKLEQEVQKQKEARAARRAERARSISPTKPTQSSTPTHRPLSRATTNASLVSSPPVSITPPTSFDSREHPTTTPKQQGMEPVKTPTKDADAVPEFKGFGSIKRSSTSSSNRSSTITQDAESTPAPSATNLARSGTLSWQQRPRPGSRIGGSRPQSMLSQESRPQSMLAQESRPADEKPTHARNVSKDEPEPSRDQIAASLGARDPSWFRQTADRGIGSAAYRKSKDEMSPAESVFSGRRGLPGMSRESSIEPESRSPPASESVKSDLVSRGGSVRGSILSNGSRYSGTSTSSGKADLKSLIAADEEQQKASPTFDQSSTTSGDSGSVARTLTMSTSQARLTNANDRPVSPTKGMGGFVQSAMMKRSDSQNKRWSAQQGASLSRNNSVASLRSGLGGLQGSHSMPKLDPTTDIEERRKEPQSRPTSSSNDLTSLATNTAAESDVFVKPALPRHHSRSKSVASNYSASEDTGVPQSPGSPSKRYSPTKSSWLESSITRPESPPKPAPSKNATPTWMADLAKAKAQRASVDLTSYTSGSKEEGERPPSRPGSPTKSTPFGPALLKRAESKEATNSPQSTTPTNKIRPLRLADKFTSSPAATSPTSKSAVGSDSLASTQLRAEAEAEPSKTSPDEHQKDRKSPAVLSAEEPVSREQAQSLAKDTSAVNHTAQAHTTQFEEPAAAAGPTASPSLRNQTFKATPEPKPETKSDAISKPPVTDFRSQLKSRPRAETKSKEEPEFLAKFGQLRKAQQEKYVAPDVLKDNILRGKTGLAVTGGPVKTVRKDELKESLQAKKDDIKKAIEEGRDLPGQAHHRKTSSVAQPVPSKPEALAKRELLARSDSGRSVPDRTREATPEALSRHKSLKQKPNPEPSATETRAEVHEETSPKEIGIEKSSTMPANAEAEAKFQPLSKQISEPSVVETKQSKLAARFNPGLAGMLARGPPSATPSRPDSPATPGRVASPAQNSVSEPPAAGAPLQDVRKDRARGPKRLKGVAKTETAPDTASGVQEPAVQNDVPTAGNDVNISNEQQEEKVSSPPAKPKPSALTGSAASVMLSSLNKSPSPRMADTSSFINSSKQELPSSVEDAPASVKPKPQALPGSAAAVMRASLGKNLPVKEETVTTEKTSTPTRAGFSSTLKSQDDSKDSSPAKTTAVPEFKGFGSARSQKVVNAPEDNKENAGSHLPSVKASASQWGRRPVPEKVPPPMIELPTRKDDDAAMRSAGLLASSPQTTANNGLGISIDKARNKAAGTPPTSAGLPPKPAKSSRVVSGQLAEASPNKGSENTSATGGSEPKTIAGRLLIDIFGAIPKYHDPLAIDTSAVIASDSSNVVLENIKTVRKSVLLAAQDGSFQTAALAPHEDYTFFDESIYACTHVYTTSKGTKNADVYLWIGESASETAMEAANGNAKRIARENSAASVQLVRQGSETAQFLQAMGGIFITRRGTRETSPKQYMLLGRKHIGHVVFDEVDFGVESLCAGFVYLISYPVTLQQTKLYLWKGQGCSAEELSASRLAAMDISETGEIIEVDGGAEFSSFLKIFAATTTKQDVAKSSALWQQKALAPDKFRTRLFRVQQAGPKPGILTSLWNRRPSWNRLSPARSPARDQVKVEVEAKEICAFTQAQLEADGVYLLDALSELFILLGPLHATQIDKVRDTILGQTLLFASDYAIMAASMEDRMTIPKCSVLFSGVPRDVKVLFRHFDESQGLWGTASLMAGLTHGSGNDVRAVSLEDMLTEICRD